MSYYLKAMDGLLDESDRRLLKRIYAPTFIATPPSDPSRNSVVMPNGEIRIYGMLDKREPDEVTERIYIASRDAGLSWKTYPVSYDALGPAGYNPESGRWIGVRGIVDATKGLEILLSDVGPDDTAPRRIKLSDENIHVLKKPQYLPRYRRWILLGELREKHLKKHVHVFLSDDDGESWRHLKLPHAPIFEVKPPHKGPRWQECSCEPTVADLGDRRLMMLVRTSQDYHYIHFSNDGGDTWTDPAPSPFHGTITMPVLQNLSDGRVVLFWCNTQPMPELDHESAMPPLDEKARIGFWEDVFTNRDANHLAITSDAGKTWQGMRELCLNPIRCNADFRSIGGAGSRDKSVHQAELIELPENKLLVVFGQNTAVRKIAILDLAWLSETERREDLRLGLVNLSTQMYLESNLGNYRGFSGHCAYNRTNGALLVPDPDMNHEEALQICRVSDPRLVSELQGAVWNFPAAKKGEVKVKLMTVGAPLRLSLLDRWVNPSDETAPDSAFATLPLDMLKRGEWQTVTLKFDTETQSAEMSIDGGAAISLPTKEPAPLGLSYLHLQTTAETEDLAGSYVKTLSMKAIE